MYKKVSEMNLAKTEEEVLKFWQEKDQNKMPKPQ